MRLEQILEKSEKAIGFNRVKEILNSKQQGKIYLYYVGFLMKDRTKKENKNLREVQGILNYSSARNYCGMFQIKKYEDLYYYFFRR